MSCDPKLYGKSIVLFRAFNPAIFQLLWFSSGKILIPEKAKSAKVRVITPDSIPVIKLVIRLLSLNSKQESVLNTAPHTPPKGG